MYSFRDDDMFWTARNPICAEDRQALIDNRFADCNDEEKLCILHLACTGGDDEMVKALLSADPKPDINGTVCVYNLTPLHIAAQGGVHAFHKVVRTLMTADPIPDVHKPDTAGRSALDCASARKCTRSNLLLMDSRPSLE